MDNMENIYSIDAPHFNAGVVSLNGKIILAAPIVRYMMGWEIEKVKEYCEKKRWKIEYWRRY
jgi:hypothetical protein